MKRLRLCVAVALVGICIAGAAQKVAAQVSINIGVGAPVAVAPVTVAPVCPYGYFNYAPYACAPFGYYAPQWFVGGVFIGAGPWYGWGWGHYHGPWGYYHGGGYHGGGYYRGGGYYHGARPAPYGGGGYHAYGGGHR